MHNRSPRAYIKRPTTMLGTKPAPFMAAFSSKGPNSITPDILKVLITLHFCSSWRDFSLQFDSIICFLEVTHNSLLLCIQPDITAPGVSVIAAYSEAQGPTNQEFDRRRIPFNSVSGTSMSCPHISGIVGLLKTLYPHWSPAAIKSAIMTTGKKTNPSSFHFS